jgi:hypothetical protein
MNTATDSGATHLFWTGGWDSTFRLLQLLLKEGRIVQPYYVLDRPERRPAVSYERDAMSKIRSLLRVRHPGVSDNLRATVECAFNDVPHYPEVTAAYEGSLRFGFIGGQYEWLARYCLNREIRDMELSIHRDDKARELIAEIIDPSRSRVDDKFARDARYELFKHFRFPLFDTSKEKMRLVAREEGFEELMNLTWFCHRPIGGEPCGVCNPCVYTIEEGLEDRLTAAGRKRYQKRIMPRLRQALARHTGLYLAARSVYRRLRG